MAKTTTRKTTKPEPEPATPQASGVRLLGALAGLGLLSALWALFLWTELVRARTGAGSDPFCGFGGSDCGALWNAAFASTVHRLSGLPVAAWGLVWGLAACGLPVAALVAAAEGRRASGLRAAVVVVAAAGVLGVAALLAASAAAGLFCSSCALTYALTLAYGAVALVLFRRESVRISGASVGVAAGVVVGCWALLLYPGLRTPRNVAAEGQRALAAVANRTPGTVPRDEPKPPPEKTSKPSESETPPIAPPPAPQAPPPSPVAAGGQLEQFLAGLQPQVLQAIADSLEIYRSGPALPMEAPRALLGPADAPVRFIEFTDALCSHCASLHATMSYLRAYFPPTAFAIDARHFPLDGNCNPYLEVRGPESVRCLAARAQICLEDSPNAFDYSGLLFENQERLTPDLVYQLAAPWMPHRELERCVASPETQTKLRADVDCAWEYEPDGTPLVLINGRRGTSFGPFLYALVVTGGRPDDPAFAVLPPPSANAHLH